MVMDKIALTLLIIGGLNWGSVGLFQFDLWNVTPSTRWDWNGLRERVKKTGLRNSLLVAPMPTASTSRSG